MSYLGIDPQALANRIEAVVKGADTPEDKLRASLEIEELVTALGILKSGLDAASFETFGTGTVKVASRSTGEVMKAKVTASTSKTVDADGLRSAILARIGDHTAILYEDEVEGEERVLRPPSQIAAKAAEVAFLLSGSGTPGYAGWRVKPLKELLGLSVAEYTTSEITGHSVKLA